MVERILSTDTVRAALREDGVPDPTIDAVVAYVRTNPLVWQYFEVFALSAIRAKRRVGAKAVFERVRWEVQIKTGQRFKANNNFPSYLARIFETKHPSFEGYFRKRAIKGLSKVNV